VLLLLVIVVIAAWRAWWRDLWRSRHDPRRRHL